MLSRRLAALLADYLVCRPAVLQCLTLHVSSIEKCKEALFQAWDLISELV